VQWRVLPLVLALGAAACTVDPARAARDRALTDLEIAVGQHRFALAEARARRFLPEAGARLDERCPALLALARAVDGQGRASEALDVLATLGRECAAIQESSARGLVQVATLAERLGRPAVALRAWARVVTAFPDDPAARRAAEAIRTLRRDAAGTDAAVEALRRLYRAVPDREVSPYLLFLAARLVEDSAPVRALALYRRIAEVHPASGMANDALLAAARLALALDRAREAADLAERLLAQRRWSYLLGSYDLDLYPDAAFLRAEAAGAAREPPSEVAGWYAAFVRWFPKDPRVPEARLRAARVLESRP
jgi:tetratricopeptide (TPR) repeat protein